jgi:HEPN domain-containing protein
MSGWSMNPLTLEWVDKAEGDYFPARREFRARKSPNYDAVCFHAQQAAEKYLKAILKENGTPIPRILSLAELLALLAKNDSSFMILQTDLNVMEGYAVQFRYPGLSADKVEAKSALFSAENVRSFARNRLGL